MPMNEIGSEFEWNYSDDVEAHSLDWLPYYENEVFTFSGRTAIELALSNIQNARKALLPACCCDSMIAPFRNVHIEVEFYSVSRGPDSIEISIDRNALMEADVLFVCSYFGFAVDYPESLIKEFREQGGIVIEDITHSLLATDSGHEFSDYYVASLRKWGALLDGGYCSGKNTLQKSFMTKPSKEFLNLKASAMKRKTEYLQGQPRDKQAFLDDFGKSNHWLAENYSRLLMSEESERIFKSWNIDEMRKQRIRNAEVLYCGLQDIELVRPVFSKERLSCPLFFPVSVEPGRRTALKSFLIKNDIYCPVHWPKPEETPQSDLYDCELSLICDQRYTETDMERIVNVIKAFE